MPTLDTPPLLLVMLSVIALWALLVLLAVGLLVILKALESIRGHLRKITAGVRAIEHETAPLGALGAQLQPAAGELGQALTSLADRLREADAHLGAAAPVLRTALRR